MSLLDGVAMIISSIIVILIRTWARFNKLKRYFEKIFLVNRKFSFAYFAMIFYIFGISYLILYRVLLLDFLSIIGILFPAIGFIVLYRLVIKFYP